MDCFECGAWHMLPTDREKKRECVCVSATYKSSPEWVERPSSKYLIPQVTPVRSCLGPSLNEWSKYDDCKVGREATSRGDPNAIAAKLQIGLCDVTTASATTTPTTGVGESWNEGGRGRYLARPWQRLRVRPVRAYRHGATASIADFGSEAVDAGATSWPNFISQHDLWPEQLCTVINRRQGAIWRQSENWTIGQSHAQAHTQRKRIRLTYDANLIALSLSLSRLTVALTAAVAVG